MITKTSAMIAAILVAASSTPAFAQEQGYGACYMASASQSKMFFTPPFAISKPAMEGIEARYVQMLRDKRYSSVGLYDPPSTPPPALRGACSFYPSQAAATEALSATRQGAAKQGLSDIGTAFEG